MSRRLRAFLRVADVLALPFVVPAALLMKLVRRAGTRSLPLTRQALHRLGVFPVRRHYYEPLFDPRQLRRPLSEERALPGIDWNEAGQLATVERLVHGAELADLAAPAAAGRAFRFGNGEFESGDAEFWYGMLRVIRPRRLVEIGSGHSTLMAARAIRRNREEDPGYACRHVCIEPYEQPWLESLGVEVVRSPVETVGLAPFRELGAGDVLFIDSSHMIRPQGDVLFELLEILPSLAPGVVVHVHDIFTPRDYLDSWVREDNRFWNEQYLLEAFLTHNREWKVVAALNWLTKRHFERLRRACPYLTPEREPGSIYLRREG